MNATACFDASTFQRLLAGKLAAAEVEAVASHLESCDRCVQTARGLPEDTLADAVRAAQRLPALGVEGARLNALISKVLQLRSSASTMSRQAPDHPTGVGPAAAPAAATAPSAVNIGRYRIVRELGRGGMGTVYEAEDLQLRRRVAVKVPQFSGSSEKQAQMRQRFLREARAAATVDHPNVCPIFDVGEENDRPFVVMAFVEGKSLADTLPAGKRLKDRQAVILTVHIAKGLMAVHKHGIVHRDLKPGNILLKGGNSPVLTDFGLAHVHADSAHLTGEGAILGTPAYMAPEQAVPDLGPVTPRTDLYSLAVVLFQMLTGRLPVEGGPMQIVAHHLQRKPVPPPSQFRPKLDRPLDAILRKALAYRPENRYRDVSEFVEALSVWLRAPGAQPDVKETTQPEWIAIPVSTEIQLPALPVAEPVTVAQEQSQPVRTSVLHWRASSRQGPRLWPLAAALVLMVGVGIIIAVDNKGKNPTVVSQPDKKTPNQQPKPDQGLMDEDFRKAFDNGPKLPAGWISDTLVVEADKKDSSPYLGNSKREVDQFVKVPLKSTLTGDLFTLSGDFFVEGEYLLSSPGTGLTALTIWLESQNGGAPMRVAFDYLGGVTIADFKRHVARIDGDKPNHFRLVRKGNNLNMQINFGPAGGTPHLDEIVQFDRLRIGLRCDVWAASCARLYRLKVGTLPPAPDDGK